MKEPEPSNPAAVCPRCGTPVRPNTQFCDHCGARIIPPPACSLCGTLLEPNSRFCSSCGTMIGTSPDQRPDKEESAGKKPAAAGREATGPAEEGGVGAASPQPTRSTLWRRRASITIPPGIRAFLHPSAIIARYEGTILIIIALILILTGVFTLVGSGYFQHTEPIVTITPSATPVVFTPTTMARADEGGGNISFVPGPVELPPEEMRIYLRVERDPRSYVVSVLYEGGKGQYGVRDILVRLTRSDGKVLTATFRPDQIGSGVELQGTEKTDRVEVTTRYNNGNEYKNVDQVFEYKVRT